MDLPLEAWWNIFRFLDFDDLTKVALVCSQWRELCADDQFWKLICCQRNWNKMTTWKQCFQQKYYRWIILNKRLSSALDDYLKWMGFLNNTNTNISSSNSVELCKQYLQKNSDEEFTNSMQDISLLNSCGFRNFRSTMLECNIVEKTVTIPIFDVVDLILNLNHRILWDQAMYGGNPLEEFIRHDYFSTNTTTSIPIGFESIPEIKLVSIDTADMFWSVGTRDDLELIHLRCFRGVYKIADDALLLLEEGFSADEDPIFSEPFPTTTTYQDDDVLKVEASNLPHYQQADRFVVKSTGFFLQRMDESTTKIVYLIQLATTDEFDWMVLEVRQRLRTLALTRMANYYRTPLYKAVKNGTALPVNQATSSK